MMTQLSFLIMSMGMTGWSASAQPTFTPPEDHSHCQELLDQARADLADPVQLMRMVESSMTIATEGSLAQEGKLAQEGSIVTEFKIQEKQDFEFLTGLVLPKGYAENKAAFEAARARAQKEFLPRLEKIRKAMEHLNPDMTFKEKLWWLGNRFDGAPEPEDRVAILSRMLSIFSIKVENIYMELLEESHHSPELKLALYKGLAKIFKNDRSWMPYLDRAMRASGVAH